MLLKNLGEPAYSSCLVIKLPIPVKRVPIHCIQDEVDFNMICHVPKAMSSGEEIIWDIEMQEKYVEHDHYTLISNITIRIICSEPSDDDVTDINTIVVKPKYDFVIFG